MYYTKMALYKQTKVFCLFNNGCFYCFKAVKGSSLFNLKDINTLEAIETIKASKNIYNKDKGLNIYEKVVSICLAISPLIIKEVINSSIEDIAKDTRHIITL